MKKFLISAIFLGAAVAATSASTSGVPEKNGVPETKIPAAVPAKKSEKKSSEISPEAEKKLEKIFVDFCEISAPVKIAVPAFAEEKNLQDKIFDDEAKLKTSIPNTKFLNFVPAKNSLGNGKFSLKNSAENSGDELQVFRFFVETQAFAKVKISAKTALKCEIYADGKKIADKLSAENSEEDSGTASGEIPLPNSRAEILVKILVPAGTTNSQVEFWVETEKDLEKAAISFPKFGEKRRLTIADVNEGERVSGTEISPNGEFVLLRFSEMLPDGQTRSRSEVREIASGKIVFWENGTNFSWMPKGARLVEKKISNGKAAYVAWELASGTKEILAENLSTEDCREIWLPDESGFIVVKTEKWKDENDNFKRVANISDRIPGYRDRRFLFLYRFRDGAEIRLTSGSASTALEDISSDGKKILFATGTVDYAKPEFEKNSLYLMSLENFEIENLISDEAYDFSAKFSPGGNEILLISGPNSFGGIGKNLPAGTLANSFDKQAFVMNLDSKKISPITKNFDPSIKAATWAGNGKIYFTCEDKDFCRVFEFSPDSEAFKKIDVPAEVATSFSISRSRADFKPIAAAVGQSSTIPPRAYLVDLTKNSSTEIFASLPNFADEIAVPEVRDWNFVSEDGTEIVGQYFLPPNFDASKKYPLIVYYYGGTSPVSRAFSSHYSFPLWASKGYVVYVLQPSGATGFGQEFSARHVNAWGKKTADDIIAGTKKFCAEHSFINAEKIGCIGASYGGFMTMYLQTRTDIFAAAVAHAGISDITSYWGEGFWGAAYNSVAAAGSFPWKNKEIFVEQSPLFSADKVKTPILFCHGKVDTNVPVGESIQMFSALKLLGKPVELLTFKDENHFIFEYSRRKQWIKSHLAWFARWLKDDPDAWNFLYPDSEKNL